ncbi:hypothetical protein BpHYR1_043058 [Brachionus plicatilis]|uniref:Uncharacterized protein n=1 Tax=Brachionus plicatilis TaxID=10195 RepID=A0A3M7RF88_BRAPC|nr:hypothetical protein BpHYR1_043058 [Brachionus plicatilis]
MTSRTNEFNLGVETKNLVKFYSKKDWGVSVGNVPILFKNNNKCQLTDVFFLRKVSKIQCSIQEKTLLFSSLIKIHFIKTSFLPYFGIVKFKYKWSKNSCFFDELKLNYKAGKDLCYERLKKTFSIGFRSSDFGADFNHEIFFKSLICVLDLILIRVGCGQIKPVINHSLLSNVILKLSKNILSPNSFHVSKSR